MGTPALTVTPDPGHAGEGREVTGKTLAVIGGGVIAGLGVGVLFRGAIGTALAIAEPGHAGETVALLFLIAYAGPVIPVLAVGIGLAFAPPLAVLLVFIVLVLAATVDGSNVGGVESHRVTLWTLRHGLLSQRPTVPVGMYAAPSRV